MAEDRSFWSTLPGLLTAIAGVVAAIAALLTALYSAGLLPKPAANTSSVNSNPSYQQVESNPQKKGSNAVPGGDIGDGPAHPAPPPESASAFALSKHTFTFPGDGTKNNNGTIGPFCCTGETATVTKVNGSPVGYIYFYDFADAVNLSPTSSAAAKVGLLVSSESSDSPGSDQVKSELWFDAANAGVGSVRTTTIGLLKFTATLRRAQLAGGTRYDMSSINIDLDVEPVQP